MRVACYTKLLILFFTGSLLAEAGPVYTVKKNIQHQAEKNGEVNQITFSILKDSEKVYDINTEVAYDVPFPQLKIFDNGSSVLIDAFDARLTFYEASGFEIRQVNILKDYDIEYERSVYSTIDGEILVIAANQPGLDYILIQIYNYEGHFIRQTVIDEKHISALAYSEKFDLIAVSAYSWRQNDLKTKSLFINNQEELTIQNDISFSHGNFILEKNIFTGYSNNSCFIYDIGNNEVLFTKSADKNNMILWAQLINNQFTILETKNPVLKKGQWFYQNPAVNFFSLDGLLIRKGEIDCLPFADYQIKVKDSDWIFQTENETILIKK